MTKNNPYTANDLFRSSEPGILNACVGKNGGPYDLYAYSLGYFRAAGTLAQIAIDNHLPSDVDVYPIVYNYRHAIELGIKHLIDLLPPIWGETITYNKPTHKLLDAWPLVRPYLARESELASEDELNYMDTVLADIVQFDADGEVFRFPADKGGNFFLQDVAHINIQVLMETLESVRELFETWFMAGQALLYMKSDMDISTLYLP